jgi:hypothetical protein
MSDGFELFLREAVGFPGDVPGADHGGQVSIAWGDPKQ